MTGKEIILAALAGERSERVPFVPNIWQWYYVNSERGSLPAPLAGTTDPVDALRILGADVFSKFDGHVYRETEHTVGHQTTFEGEHPGGNVPWNSFTSFEGGPIRHERVQTPAGDLTHTWEYHWETGAPFESKHWWTDFDAEYEAMRYWMEDVDYRLDAPALKQGLEKIGDDGTVLLQMPPSPLKRFHWLAGQEMASYFISDHPTEMAALAEIHIRKVLEYTEAAADLPDVWVYEVPDNVDSMFYPPAWFRELCVPMLKKQAEILHSRGKYLFVHACGRLKALGPLFVESGLDCVEGQAPPPIGDWPLHEARALSDRLIICGGQAAPEQELTSPDSAERIDFYVKNLFASMGNKQRFLFGSSCNISPLTPWSNLVAFRDACWKYGKLS